MALFFLAIYIVTILLRPQEWWGPLYAMRLVNYAAIATLLASFVAFPRVLSQFKRFTDIPHVLIAIILLFGATVSGALGYLDGDNMVFAFEDLGKNILLFLVILLLGRHPKHLRIIMWTAGLCVALLAVHGILQINRGYGFGGVENTPMIRGRTESGEPILQITAFSMFGDPNDLCLLFLTILPMMYAEFRATSNVIGKSMALAVTTLLAIGVYLTNSRGGIVGAMGMVGGYALVRFKGVRRWLVIIAGVFLITVLSPARFAGGPGTDRERIYQWSDGMDSFKRVPIFGVGYRKFPDYVSGNHKAAHNAYVEVLSETGVVGYLPWFSLIFLTFMYLRRTNALKEFVSRPDQCYLAGLYAAMCGHLTGAYFLAQAYNPALFVLLSLTVCAIIVACHEHNLFSQVFGGMQRDLVRSVFWGLVSIPVLWLTIRIAFLRG